MGDIISVIVSVVILLFKLDAVISYCHIEAEVYASCNVTKLLSAFAKRETKLLYTGIGGLVIMEA